MLSDDVHWDLFHGLKVAKRMGGLPEVEVLLAHQLLPLHLLGRNAHHLGQRELATLLQLGAFRELNDGVLALAILAIGLRILHPFFAVLNLLHLH